MMDKKNEERTIISVFVRTLVSVKKEVGKKSERFCDQIDCRRRSYAGIVTDETNNMGAKDSERLPSYFLKIT